MADQEGSVNFTGQGQTSFSGSATTGFEVNTLARYTAEGELEGSEPTTLTNQSGPVPDLIQTNSGQTATVGRDTSLGVTYWRFSAQDGDFYRTPDPFEFPSELTVLAFLRLRLDRESPGPRAVRRVGTFLNLGNRDVQLFYDHSQQETDIQTRVPGGSARFTAQEGTDADWRLYGVVFGEPYNYALLDETVVPPSVFNPPEQDASGTFDLALGQDLDLRGYLDADVAFVQVFNGRANEAQLRDMAQAFFAELYPKTDMEGVGTATFSGQALDHGGSTTFTGVGVLNSAPCVDPGDIPNVLAWHNGEDPRFSGLEKCDRVPTWYDSSNNTRDFGMESQVLCQPYYDPEFYNGGGALKFAEEGRGVVSCIFSGLACEPYTIFILGRGAKGTGFRCFYRIGNAIGVGLKQNATDKTRDDLIITTNPGHVSSRQVIYEAAIPRDTFFELMIQGQEAVPDWTLDVSVDRVLLVPTSVESNEEPDAIIISDPCDPSQVYTPEDPYSNPYRKTFKLEKDGYIYIGEGNCPAYAQIAWYNRVLDADDLRCLYAWVDGRY